MIPVILQVALGGALGASARFLTGQGLHRVFGSGLPFATLAVNLIGSFAMGVLIVLLAHKGGTRFSPFLLTGLLGGFTTFSAFSLDTLVLFERGQVGAAAGYVLVSVIGSLAAIFAGVAIARGVWP
ncbi:MAG: fluoride efflux transporter CrcB [Paracoccaceae bacterium]